MLNATLLNLKYVVILMYTTGIKRQFVRWQWKQTLLAQFSRKTGFKNGTVNITSSFYLCITGKWITDMLLLEQQQQSTFTFWRTLVWITYLMFLIKCTYMRVQSWVTSHDHDVFFPSLQYTKCHRDSDFGVESWSLNSHCSKDDWSEVYDVEARRHVLKRTIKYMN